MNIKSYKTLLSDDQTTLGLYYHGGENIFIEYETDTTIQIAVPRAALEQFLKLIEVT